MVRLWLILCGRYINGSWPKQALCPPSLNGTPMFPNGTRLSRCHTGHTDHDTPKGRGIHQDAFTRALLRPDLPTPSDIIAPAHDSATRRFAVYRNNVIASLSDALETTFPAIRALLGDTNFRNIAGVYCRAHPPTSPIMQLFGADFGVFLDGLNPSNAFPICPISRKLESPYARPITRRILQGMRQ